MAHMFKYVPFSFSNPPNWARLAGFWLRPENRPVTNRIERLRVVVDPKLLDCWKFDCRYTHLDNIKNHLDGARHLITALTSDSTELLGLKRLDISIAGDRKPLSRSPCEMKPSWSLFTSLEKAFANRFNNLTALQLEGPSDDVAILLRSVSSELCANLRTFSCTSTNVRENLTDTINVFIKRCPNLMSLSLPSLSSKLRLHPDNAGLKELIIFADKFQELMGWFLENSFLELFPTEVAMSKGADWMELWDVAWNVGWDCK